MVDGALFQSETEAKLTRLYQVAYSILRKRQDAEVAVQQGLMKAWAVRHRAQQETFSPWLMRIVVNECRNIQRYRKRVVPAETVEETAVPFSAPDPDLWNAVESLPENLRLPFSLKYIAQFTEQEVARAMHLPVSTIKNRLSKARKTLRAALSEWEVTFE